MERGLTIEHDEVVVTDVTLHFVTNLQMKVRWLWMVPEMGEK